MMVEYAFVTVDVFDLDQFDSASSMMWMLYTVAVMVEIILRECTKRVKRLCKQRSYQTRQRDTMPAISKKGKRPPVHCSYIVAASDPDDRITQEGLMNVRRGRDTQDIVRKTGDQVTIVGFQTVVNEERCDRNMVQQLMTHLASTTVIPMKANAPNCTAFAHTSNMTPTATVDRSCMSFRVPHLSFDTHKFLKQVMSEETKDNGFKGVFAPFAAKHVKKVLRIVPNFEVHTPAGIARDYHVEMCILTGMGILVARGLLYIPRDQMEAVDKMHPGTITFTNAHINWHTWGFDAERRWETPWKCTCIGHPFS